MDDKKGEMVMDCQYEKVAGQEELETEQNQNALLGGDKSALDVMIRTEQLEMLDDTKSNRKFLYIAACIGNLAAFVCGTAFGWTSPEIPILNTQNPANPLPTPITPVQDSWIGSLLPVGAALGPFAAGFGADRLGRKRTLLLGIVPFILAFGLSAFASSVPPFYLARFLSGVGVGIIFTVLPMYIGEIADDQVRGALGSFMQLFITFGFLFAFIIGPYTTIMVFNLSCMVVPIVFLLLFYFYVPESPYYLIMNQQHEIAEFALIKLRGQPKYVIREEFDATTTIVEETLADRKTFIDIFRSIGLVKAMIICVGLVGFQQFSGINIVMFYAQSIFIDAGSTLAPELSTIVLGVVQMLASGTTPVLVEKLGKRILLFISAIGMTVSHAVLAYFFYLKDSNSDVGGIAWLPVLSLIIYVITYCLGFGPLPWAVMGELFPGNVKSAASTATAVICWVLGFIITKYFSLISMLVGKAGSFAFFSFCCLLAIVFVYFFVPETSGKSFNEIQAILNGETKNNDRNDKKEKC